MFVKPDAYKILRQERTKKGLTGTELGRRMGLKSPQHYWNIEHNKNHLTLEYAFAAANALGVSVDIFCEKVKENI